MMVCMEICRERKEIWVTSRVYCDIVCMVFHRKDVVIVLLCAMRGGGMGGGDISEMEKMAVMEGCCQGVEGLMDMRGVSSCLW